jgi:butyrate kinase
MLDDLRSARFGEHASNLGAILAAQIAAHYHCPAYIADPVVVDEMDSVAKISGMPAIERKSIFHALNQKSAAREVARRIKKKYEACNFIVAHLGGGISVGAHCQGRVIDVNNALEGDGPFSPERSGGLPSLQLVELVLQNPQAPEEIKKRIVGAGGMAAYCGTNDLKEISARIKNGDEYAALIYQAMAYQISKEIAMHGATLKGAIDGIILTGGMAKDTDLVEKIKERVSFLAPVHVICGEREMQSLAENIYAVLHEKLEAREY